ncbi:MAG: methionyl-tRNA formyltransferase [Rhodanobacteraceae bacterium]
MRLVFAGTPAFALPGLAACHAADVDIAAVYTQPDRPSGRGRRIKASPVKQAALAAGIAVEQPPSLKTPAARERLRAFTPDLIVVIAYGLILPRSVLAMPRLGCWNIHASLLPRWRGAAPIQRAILAGDRHTGVTLMQMQAGLDTGPVMRERATPILPTDTGATLHDRLAALGAELLGEALDDAVRGTLPAAVPQAIDGVTYADKLDKREARLDWNEDAAMLARKVRAFNPWPVAEADLAGEQVRIWQAEDRRETTEDGARTRHEMESRFAPGTVIAAEADGIDVACQVGVLRITELQRPGGRRMPVGDWLNARPDLWMRR